MIAVLCTEDSRWTRAANIDVDAGLQAASRKKMTGSDDRRPERPADRPPRSDQVERKHRRTEFGLSSAVFTQSEARGLAFALKIEAGMTHVSDATMQDHPNVKFGGEKNFGAPPL